MGEVYKNVDRILVDNIDRLLAAREISGAQMSEDLGMSRSFMTELRKGRAKSVKVETAQKIASYFGVSVGYLLGEEDTPDQQMPTGSLDLSNITEAQRMVIEAVLKMPEQKLEALALMLGL